MTNKIFCVIPAYNEEKFIAKVIREVKKYTDQIVVVDDGSADKTAEIALAEGVNIVRHLINRDQGAALQTGDEYALKHGATVIIHFDADGQFNAEEIKDIVAPILSGESDIVFGSRFLSKKSVIPFSKERIIFPLARLVNLIFFKAKLTDPQSGYRALSRSAAEKIIIEQDGKAHCSEIIAKVMKYKLRYKEIPITVTYDDYGQKFGGGIRIIIDLVIKSLIS